MNVQSVAVPRVAGSTRPAWAQKWLSGEARVAWLFILPSLVGFVMFYAVPAVRGVAISFTNWDLLRPPQFVGTDNYQRLLADGEFWQSLLVTTYYVLLNIPVQTFLALGLTVMMDRLTKSVLLRGVLILPWLMPNVVVALIWLWMLDPSLGVVNQILGAFGISRQPFLGSPSEAMPAIAWMNIWRHMGYTALLFFAGLQTIPQSVYEAAAIDGANEVRVFWSITLPLLRPVMVFVLVTTVVGSFQIFDTRAVTTKGGPVNATKVVNWYIYDFAFSRFQMGYLRAGQSDLA